MKRIQVAERVLSWVMNPKCAAATAGDLEESSRGAFSFMLAVARTAAAFLLRGLFSRHGAEAAVGGAIFWAICVGILLAGQFVFFIPQMWGDPHPLDAFGRMFAAYWSQPQAEFWRWGWLLAGLVSPRVPGKGIVYWMGYGAVGFALATLASMPTDGLITAAIVWLWSLDHGTEKPAVS